MSSNRLCEIIVLENTWSGNSIPTGWGNGYVAISKGHPLYGVYFMDERMDNIDVHGAVTFSAVPNRLVIVPTKYTERTGVWVLGFDTGHYGDTKENWPKEAVIAETNRLREQLLKMYK